MPMDRAASQRGETSTRLRETDPERGRLVPDGEVSSKRCSYALQKRHSRVNQSVPIDQNVDRGRVTTLKLARIGGSVLAIGCYAFLRLWAAVAPAPSIFPDSADYARVAQGLTFSALSSSTGGKNVAWSYYFEVKRGTAWYRFMTLGWSRKAGAVKHSYFYPVSRMNLDDHPERRCAYYHVIAHNPRGDSAVVRFHDEQGRQLICVP